MRKGKMAKLKRNYDFGVEAVKKTATTFMDMIFVIAIVSRTSTT